MAVWFELSGSSDAASGIDGCPMFVHISRLTSNWLTGLILGMTEVVGIFEAKTKLSEICAKVAETGVDYVITRRGQPIARIVAPVPVPSVSGTGILSRMKESARQFGPISADGPDFPDVWITRRGSKESPLESEGGAE